jgi:RNA-directed DNA polymerase
MPNTPAAPTRRVNILHIAQCVGGVLSPLLANVALSVLDEHFTRRSRDQQALPRRHQRGLPWVRLIRYADDWILLVRGDRAHAEALHEEAAAVLAPMGLRLSTEKTKITHIDEGLDFLGWRIQRHRKRGTAKSFVYTYPSKKAVRAVTGKVRTLSRLNKNLPLEVLLHTLNPVLRGWCTYFQPGVSSATFRFLRAFAWRRVIGWLRRKHLRMNWKRLRQRYCHGGWWPTDGSVALFDPGRMRTTQRRPRPAPRAPIWARTTPRSAAGGAPRKPSARLATTSSSPTTTLSATAFPIRTWDRTGTTDSAPPNSRLADSSANSSDSA